MTMSVNRAPGSRLFRLVALSCVASSIHFTRCDATTAEFTV